MKSSYLLPILFLLGCPRVTTDTPTTVVPVVADPVAADPVLPDVTSGPDAAVVTPTVVAVGE